MKSKKQKQSHTKKNKQMQSGLPIARLDKQFQLIYRTCDKLPSSEQYQSVIFLKRKKIGGQGRDCGQGKDKEKQKQKEKQKDKKSKKKSKNKKQSVKKKKIQDKANAQDNCQTQYGKTQSLGFTKSTMPSSTMGAFKKSSFADTFKQKIDLSKSTLKRVNNLSSSNSSRYLSSKFLPKQQKTNPREHRQHQKSPKKKLTSPKPKQSFTGPLRQADHCTSGNSGNSIALEPTRSTHRIKNGIAGGKNKKETDQVVERGSGNWGRGKDGVKSGEGSMQYVFIDGQYVEIQNPIYQILTDKIISQNTITSNENTKNQFIDNFQIFKTNFEQQIASKRLGNSNKHVCPQSPQSVHQTCKDLNSSQLEQQYQQNQNEQQNFVRNPNSTQLKIFIQKVIFIQKWWRNYQSRKTIQKCNNIKHFPSKAESQKSGASSYRSSGPLSQQQLQPRSPSQTPNSNTSPTPTQTLLQTKQSLTHTHFTTQKQILTKMFQLKKIDRNQYTLRLLEVQSHYQRELRQIEKLRDKIRAESQKVRELRNRIKEEGSILGKLDEMEVEDVMKWVSGGCTVDESPIISEKKIYQVSTHRKANQQTQQQSIINTSNYQRQKSTGCHYSLLGQQKQKEVNQGSSKAFSYKKTETETENDICSSPRNKLSQKQLFNQQKQSDNQQQPHSQAQQMQNQNTPERQAQDQGSQVQNQNQNYNQNQNQEQNEQESQHQISKMIQIITDRQLAQAQIEKRHAFQLGMLFNGSHRGRSFINTSVIGIHNFLMSFLKFYQYFYKDEFLKLINLPFGYNQKSRLKLLQGYTPQTWNSTPSAPHLQHPPQLFPSQQQQQQQLFFSIDHIISQQILEDFHQHNYQLPENVDDATKAMVYFEKIHQKAVIQCFNECMNCFRPYYFIGGAPYSWNYSEKALTFYYIAQQNIQQVFQKTQYKVLKNASTLCGTIVDQLTPTPPTPSPNQSFQHQFLSYRQSINPVLLQNREQKLTKIQKLEMQQCNYKWQYFEEEKVACLYKVGEGVLEWLLGEVLAEMGVEGVDCWGFYGGGDGENGEDDEEGEICSGSRKSQSQVGQNQGKQQEESKQQQQLQYLQHSNQQSNQQYQQNQNQKQDQNGPQQQQNQHQQQQQEQAQAQYQDQKYEQESEQQQKQEQQDQEQEQEQQQQLN